MELATLLKNLLGRQLVQYLFWLNKQRIRRGGIRCTGYNIRYLVEYMVCLRTYQTTDRFYGIWKVEILSLYPKVDSNISNNGQGSYCFYYFKRYLAFMNQRIAYYWQNVRPHCFHALLNKILPINGDTTCIEYTC